MVYKPDPTGVPGQKNIVRAWTWARSALGLFVTAGFVAAEFQRIRSNWPDIFIIFYLSLLAITFVLVLIWIWATRTDLELAQLWLDPEQYYAPHGIMQVALIVGTGVFLAVLLYSARNAILFGIVFSIFCLVLPFSDKHARNMYLEAITASKSRLEKEAAQSPHNQFNDIYFEALGHLYRYYIKRPHFQLQMVRLFITLFGLAFAIIGRARNLRFFGIAAYIVFIIAIIMNEAIIGFWRTERDNGIRKCEAARVELLRNGHQIKKPFSAT